MVRYDLSNSVFSPDGRNFQVEYASKAVENGGTSIGIKCQDGVVLAVEKIVTSKLLVPNKNNRIQTVGKHIGVVYSGMLPDGRNLVSKCRGEYQTYMSQYKEPITVPYLIDRIGGFLQAYTCYNSVRPFGVTTIIGGIDESGPHLYMLEPSGTYWGYHGAATGKGRQSAKNELEKLDMATLSAKDAVKEAARIIYLAHEDNKDKDFEIEITWCSKSETNGTHQFVPEDLLQEAKEYAEAKLNEDSDDDETMSD
ncbi:K02727 20S proteasome subunit alpha 7 [Cyberlindnera jadinii]|uniref:K02727 20S proteasome subunit alpha 7 n=1 Tax=Cyberlindnera jadinii (strain ATCC 18201 / CBS 1600 / BCRC 20928 / JCM 3617 / NBRC 0987 / NRRL Y-1542) TaxID=983966 RepID=A0A0H5C7G5_CYBJN|nr:K02727 20S proteasome subunit alpha 7 [Cyberlindnera jadinii]